MVLFVGCCLSVGPTFMYVGDPTFTPEYRVSKDGIPTIEESASYMHYGLHAWVYAVLLPRQPCEGLLVWGFFMTAIASVHDG